MRSTLAALIALTFSVVSCRSAAIDASTPFAYPPLGVGPTPVDGVILDRGLEQTVVSRAILDALGAFRMGILKPDLQLGDLPQTEFWETDTLTLDKQLTDRHDQQASSRRRLRPGRYYGLVFIGRYRVGDGQIRFSIEPRLFERAESSSFTRYKRDYDGLVFVDSLKRVIDANLLRASRRPQSPR